MSPTSPGATGHDACRRASQPRRRALARPVAACRLTEMEAASPRSRPGRWRKPSRPFREGGSASALAGIGREMPFRKPPARASRGLPRQHDHANSRHHHGKCEEFGRSQMLLECGSKSALSLRRTARVVTGLAGMCRPKAGLQSFRKPRHLVHQSSDEWSGLVARPSTADTPPTPSGTSRDARDHLDQRDCKSARYFAPQIGVKF